MPLLLGLTGDGGKCRVQACFRRAGGAAAGGAAAGPGGAAAGPRHPGEADLAACLNGDAGCPVHSPDRWAAVGAAW